MTARPARRSYQFSLRAAFLLITIVAVGVATRNIYWAPPLEDVVVDFNQAVEEKRFDDATRLATFAHWRYPDSPTAKMMQWMVDRKFEFNTSHWQPIEGCFGRNSKPVPSDE